MTHRRTPTHIAIYLNALYNGGIERVMFNLIRGFLGRDIRVDLVLNIFDYSPYEKLLPDGTRLVNLNANRFEQRITRFAAYLRKNRPDAVLSATHFSNEIACISTDSLRGQTASYPLGTHESFVGYRQLDFKDSASAASSDNKTYLPGSRCSRGGLKRRS